MPKYYTHLISVMQIVAEEILKALLQSVALSATFNMPFLQLCTPCNHCHPLIVANKSSATVIGSAFIEMGTT